MPGGYGADRHRFGHRSAPAGRVLPTGARRRVCPALLRRGPAGGTRAPSAPAPLGGGTVTPLGGSVGLWQRASQPCAVLASLSASLACVAARCVVREGHSDCFGRECSCQYAQEPGGGVAVDPP